MVDFDVKVVDAEVNPDATSIKLNMKSRKKEPVSIRFDSDEAEVALVTLGDALGRATLQAAQDRTLKPIMQVEQYGAKPHPDGNGVLLSFMMRGSLEVTFHLANYAVPGFMEGLTAAVDAAANLAAKPTNRR